MSVEEIIVAEKFRKKVKTRIYRNEKFLRVEIKKHFPDASKEQLNFVQSKYDSAYEKLILKIQQKNERE